MQNSIINFFTVCIKHELLVHKTLHPTHTIHPYGAVAVTFGMPSTFLNFILSLCRVLVSAQDRNMSKMAVRICPQHPKGFLPVFFFVVVFFLHFFISKPFYTYKSRYLRSLPEPRHSEIWSMSVRKRPFV